MVRDCHFYNCELLLPLSSHRQRLAYVQSSPPASWNSSCFLPMGNAPKPKQLLQPETVTCDGPKPSWIKLINPQATASLPAVCWPQLSVDAQTCVCVRVLFSHDCFITKLSVFEVSCEVGFVMWLCFHFPLFKITTTLCNPPTLLLDTPRMDSAVPSPSNTCPSWWNHCKRLLKSYLGDTKQSHLGRGHAHKLTYMVSRCCSE